MLPQLTLPTLHGEKSSTVSQLTVDLHSLFFLICCLTYIVLDISSRYCKHRYKVSIKYEKIKQNQNLNIGMEKQAKSKEAYFLPILY